MVRFARKPASALLTSVSLLAVSLTAGAQYAAAQETDGDEPDVIVVRGAFIPDEKRDTSEISSIVDSSDFALTGAGDAAEALLRVTGLTLSNGRFVVVRGLNERYSSATLNGSPLPSPEPLRRVAPLDLFPTNALQSVLVQKTWSPEYSLEFGGGIIDLRTRTVPDSRFAELSISGGYNSEITADDGLLIDGGDQDWTGFDDGARNMPALVNQTFFSGDFPSNSPETNATAIALTDPSLVVLQSGRIPFDGGVEFNAGDRFDISPNLSIGVTTALGYDSSWTARDGRREDNVVAAADDTPSIRARGGQEYDRERAENQINTSALISVGADVLQDHEIKLTYLGTRSTEQGVERRTNLNDASFDGSRADITEWFERQAWTGQLSGDHYFPALANLAVGWRATYSEGLRDSPFNSVVRYDDGFTIADPEDITFQYELLNDDSTNVGIDAELPVPIFGGNELIIKGGWDYRRNIRNTTVRNFRLAEGSGSFADASDLRIDLLAEAAGLTVDQFQSGAQPESFRGSLELDAFYLAGDAEVGPVRLQGGVRYEDSLRTSDAFTRVDDDGVRERAERNEYALPAGTITFSPFDNQQVRFGYSETIIRPQFRESASQFFLNNITDTLGRGNSELGLSEVKNFDARYEWYFARDQFFTAGFFFKEIDDPIIEIFEIVADNPTTLFVNAPRAELQGFEFEFEKAFDAPSSWDLPFISDKQYYVATNYTFTNSELDIDGTVPVFTGFQADCPFDPRPSQLAAGQQYCVGTSAFVGVDASRLIPDGIELQGQSEHIFNLQLGYEDFDARSQARVLVNFSSDRILFYGELGSASGSSGVRLPTFEDPPITVDFRYNRAFDVFNRELEVGFAVQNIFNDDYVAYRASNSDVGAPDVIYDQYELGRSFGISLTGRF